MAPLMPSGPQMPMAPQGAAAPGMPMPGTGMDIPKEPIQSAGEELITKLLQMAASNPNMLAGLALGGAAREVSQLTGLTRRRQAGGKDKPGMPSAATLLGGNRGDVDQLMALQQLMQGAPQGGPSPIAQLGSQVLPMPGQQPGMGLPMPGAGIPPHLLGVV